MSYLMLTRRPEEIIDLTLQEALPAGTTLEIVLTSIKGNQARFGINAPRSVRVDRREITLRREAER